MEKIPKKINLGRGVGGSNIQCWYKVQRPLIYNILLSLKLIVVAFRLAIAN